MIKRKRKPEDNRIILVCLTVEGCEQVKGYVEIKERFMKEVLANISEHDRTKLQSILSQIESNLKNIAL